MADDIEILFPEDQQEGTEATLTRWMVNEGDAVAAHEPVAEIETDKVVVEVAAPADGLIGEIKILQDQQVNPGDVLCTLIAASSDGVVKDSAPKVESSATETGSNSRRVRLSPAVRRVVQKHQLDLSHIVGSGKDGRITLEDVENLVANQTSHQEKSKAAVAPAPPAAGKTPGSDIVPHDRMRKRIADNMVTSLLHTAPHVTAVFEADLSRVMQHRSDNKEIFASAGTPLTLTAYFIAAAIKAIRKVPSVNSRWFDEHLEIFQYINMGIGTALGDQGLIVPVLHNAQNMDLQGIAAGLSDLTTRARDNSLKPEDVRGGTFTISNHGVSGSLIATPIIINQPQSAILGIGKIEKRIKIRDIGGEDVIAIRPMCYISLTIDHRVLDGYQTNLFLTELVSTLENWA